MKVIDLLVKIANGEVKQNTKFRITWNGICRDFYYDDEEPNELNCLKNISDDYPLQDEISLNDEVEIIGEDKKLEKINALNTDYYRKNCCYESLTKEEITLDIQTLKNKFNEIIDKLNEEE